MKTLTLLDLKYSNADRDITLVVPERVAILRQKHHPQRWKIISDAPDDAVVGSLVDEEGQIISTTEEPKEEQVEETAPKKKRGRPPKNKTEE